jgi:two-component system, cell cycle response regulator
MSPRILIADDEEISLRLLKTVLRAHGHEVETATDGEHAWAALERQNGPALVIADWTMPGCNGLELCRRVRERSSAPYTYLLLLSSHHGRDDVARGLAAGADDYIIKPFYAPELIERVRSGFRILDLQRRLRAAEAQMREQASRDELTGLWSRRAILKLFDAERERIRREGGSLGVAVVDVDHFKRINDTYGHGGGDDVLRQVGLAMAGALRSYDHLGRYGGEEFLALLPGCGISEAAAVAERVRAAVAAHPVTLPSGEVIHVSVSVGVAAPANQGEKSVARVIASADRALYRAKDRGRNCIVLAQEGSSSAAILKAVSEAKSLRAAVE